MNSENGTTVHRKRASMLDRLNRLRGCLANDRVGGRNGLVKSLRGPRGGFILERSCAKITLLDIYEAMEGKCEPSGCLLGAPSCGAMHCIFGTVIKKVDGDMRGYLTRTRLSDISGLFKREPAREKKYNRN